MEQIIVGVSDCRFGSAAEHVVTTYALGSCIGLAVYDVAAGVGGLLHFMLPDSAIDAEGGRANPYRFADTGIPLLLDEAYRRGASKKRLIVAAAGAAQMVDPGNVFDIGRRNYQAMRRVLWKAGLLIRAEAIGGTCSRTVRLEIATGRLWLQEAGGQRELIAPSPTGKGGTPWRTAS